MSVYEVDTAFCAIGNSLDCFYLSPLQVHVGLTLGGIHKNKQLLLLKHLPPFTNLLLKTLFIKISNAFQVKARKYKHK